MLHLAIFVRDHAGLLTPDDADLPPRLSTAAAMLTSSDPGNTGPRRLAGQQWVAWWRDLVAAASQPQSRPPDIELRDWARDVADRRQALYDPPEFAALADRPQLRSAVENSFAAAQQWERVRRNGRTGRPAFEWATMRDVATEVARDHAVPLNAVDARAVVLDVEGQWWQVAALGFVLVSRSACADDDTARRVLRTAFVSALAA